MRRSREVPVTLLAALALSATMPVTGCHMELQTSSCVDAQGHLLASSACQDHESGAHYVYGGKSGGRVGDTVVGGTSGNNADAGGNSSEDGVTRGGFGESGAADATATDGTAVHAASSAGE